MNEFAQHTLTLGAVVLGGLISFVGSWLSEKWRWNRERMSRWDQRRLDAYVDFARAVKDESRIAMRIAAGRELGPQTDPLGLAEGRELYAIAEHSRSTLFEAVLLLGDDASVRSARVWYQAVWTCYQYVSKRESPDGEQFTELYMAAGEARAAFYDSARGSLDITNATGDSLVLRDSAVGKY